MLCKTTAYSDFDDDGQALRPTRFCSLAG
jgi:hypothetical protein